jgi:peptidoglycan hydrolase-like protein with peptidoglycan-binding domain
MQTQADHAPRLEPTRPVVTRGIRALPRARFRGPAFKVGDVGPGVDFLRAQLNALGYTTAPDGPYDLSLARAVNAFRRTRAGLRQGRGYTDDLVHAAIEDALVGA